MTKRKIDLNLKSAKLFCINLFIEIIVIVITLQHKGYQVVVDFPSHAFQWSGCGPFFFNQNFVFAEDKVISVA